MIHKVTDVSGNRQDKIANAAKVIGRSKDRLDVFRAICSGKKIKTVDEILEVSSLKNRIRVLQEGKKLASEDIVNQTKKYGKTAYEKIDFYAKNKDTIYSLVKDTNKLKKFPTKTNPQIQTKTHITIHLPRNRARTQQITIDDVDSFAKARKQEESNVEQVYENTIKMVLKNAIGESGEFVDWGGETDDLYSTRLKLNRKRISVAFGLKGRGTKGMLTPKKMGKNGDQIQRLFKSPAEIFFVQYVGQIDESIMDQMSAYAIVKSIAENKKIYYGIIDGKDTSRLVSAYASS